MPSTFYSVRAGHTLELRPGGYGEVEDRVFGKRRIPIKPLKVRFIPLGVPLPIYGLPGRDGMAQGVLYPAKAVDDIRRYAREFGGSPDKLPRSDEELADWVVEKLREHSGLGSQFIEVRDVEDTDGEPLDMPSEADPRTPHTGMMQAPIGVVVRHGKRAYCKVCERGMHGSGVNGHVRSKKHLANLRDYEERLREQAQVA